jgi:hypothetical protein
VPVVTEAVGDAATAVARTYREFGWWEARGRSAAYEALAGSVADDAELVSFIASLPPGKRQPNLLFAAARYLLGAPPGAARAVRRHRPRPRRHLAVQRTARHLPGTEGPVRDGHTCVLARDGRGIALTESHATWLHWLP